MRINVNITSRGDPAGLETVVRVLQMLESGAHQVKYILGLDNDDIESCVRMQNAFSSDNRVILSIGERPICVAEIANRCAKLFDADIYLPMGDDMVCITQHWDEIAVLMADKWLLSDSQCLWAPEAAIAPLLSGTWYNALGYIFPEYFPYWFTETWLHEIYEFLTGMPVAICGDLRFGGKLGKTRGMHELEFWWGFFNATRLERMQQACVLAGKLNRPVPSQKQLHDVFQKHVRHDFEIKGRIKQLEAYYRTSDKMSDQYKIAKKKAEKHLADNGLSVWQFDPVDFAKKLPQPVEATASVV